MGAANKVSGNKITGNKVLKKIQPKKKNSKKKSPKSYEDVFIIKRFFYASVFRMQPWVFLISIALFLHGCKHPLFPCIFYYNKTFFRGRFCMKLYWSQKKVLENKVSNFLRLFNKRTFFHRSFSVRNIRTFFRKLVSKNFMTMNRANEHETQQLIIDQSIQFHFTG